MFDAALRASACPEIATSIVIEPFDPWIEMHGSETVLSGPLDELETANEVRDRANLQIERLNRQRSCINVSGL